MSDVVTTKQAMERHVLPDDDHWFIKPVVKAWWDQYVAGGNTERPMALPDSRLRASWAGDCSRAIAYHLAKVEESDPMTVADCWRANVGTLLHNYVQEAIIEAFPGSAAEVKVRFLDVGSGHMDLLVERWVGGRLIRSSVEIKSVNGFGFKMMTHPRKPEGPRIKYIYQGALNAANMDPPPDELVIAVLSLETVSPKEAQERGFTSEYQRFSAQWTFSQEEYMAFAVKEQNRLARIIEIFDAEGHLRVPRMVPDPRLPRHVITRPDKGLFVVKDDMGNDIGQGSTWQCGYCSFQSQCDRDG